MLQNSKILVALLLCLVITTAVFAAGRCVPCKLNHYCVDGLRYQCPANTPVTQGTGAGALNECLTCVQRNGNSANPIYDDLVGDCVSCIEYSSETPYWDGSSCTACPTNTAWDVDELACVEQEAACAYEIPHDGGTLCLVESVPNLTFSSISPQSAEEETDEFIAKYGIVNVSDNYPDYWAGAMKYCQDKGLRLPTMDELVSILNAVYQTTYTCETYCAGVSADKTGCCSFYSLSIADEELYYWLVEVPTTELIVEGYLWSSNEESSTNAYYRVLEASYSPAQNYTRDNDYTRALCIK